MTDPMHQDIYRRHHPRLKVFYWVAVGICIYLIGGLSNRQILQSSTYREQQERQTLRRILIPGPRGNIYDREGRLLVGNRAVFSAVVFLNELRPEFRQEYIHLVREARDREEQTGIKANRFSLQVEARRRVVQRYMDQVNRITGRDEEVDQSEIERHFRQSLLLPLTLVHDLEAEKYARLVEQLPVDSPVQILTESARFYPYGDAACHTLGYVVASAEMETEEMPGEELMTFRQKGSVGRTGVEKAFDERLQGESGGEIWVVDPSGFQYEKTEAKAPVKGEDVAVSLDIEMQLAAEDAMGQKTGAAVALDVRTGEILVMASKPGYDLNDLSPYIPHAVYQDMQERGALQNRALQGLYPPGSTFKLVTSIAGLQAGVIDGETNIHCPGYAYVGRRKFRCHRHSGHGFEELEGAIRDSCNVFYYETGTEIGVKGIAGTANDFGLNGPTGVNLPNETRGMIVPDPEWKKKRFYDSWFPGDTANLSIGQGYLRLTPLQMATFTASLARGETRTVPNILRQDGPLPGHGGHIIGLRPEELEMVHTGMQMAVNGGTAKVVALPNIQVAGKTGTAQVRIDGRPSTLAWFVGFAPAENPQIAVAVMIEGTDPNDTYHGGSTAAPIAKAIFEEYFPDPAATEVAQARRPTQ